MAKLKNHPEHWLRDDAAADFDRLEADHGVFTVNSAGRTVAEQDGLIDRWDAGGPANRPPYLFEPARPAEASTHVKNGGEAVDIREYSRFAAVCGGYGFVQPYPQSDPVHFEHRRAAGGSASDGFPARKLYGSGWVTFLQDLLGAFGHDTGGRDGRDGGKTQAAVRHEQRSAKRNGYGTLTEDGVGGPSTVTYLLWAFLRYRAKGEPTKGQPARSLYGRPWVRLVQRLLVELGHGLVVDGEDGAKTQAAVAHEQQWAKRNGYQALKVDRVAGFKTAAYLVWAVVKFRLPWA